MIALLFTIARFVLTPCVAWAVLTHHTVAAAGLFLAAAVTDWLDGFAARTLQQETELGAFLDPLADKVLFMVTVGALAASSYTVTLPIWFFWLLVIKETSLVVGSVIMRWYDPEFVVKPLRSAKIATLWLSILVFYVLLCPVVGWYQEALYSLFFAITLYFVVVSWLLYGYEGYNKWFAYY